MAREAKKIASFKDARGNPVVVGSRVAYNYSGDVATGTVTNITPSNVKIERDAEWTNRITYVHERDGTIKPHIAPSTVPEYSNVKNRRGIIVIYEGKTSAAQMIEKENAIRAGYESQVAASFEKLQDKEQKINERTTELIKTVINSGDIDEIKDKLVELFGEDVLKHQEDIPEWAKEILGY